ncbi:proline--tRNA ligase [Actinomycetospora corticicola]|uniref:Proline--tRNA ligase n=1 Tax=Actinomycetospora corticicola TaxID=663602 RepID=A0A7Y9DW07_9PSEU|nr:proline--tRNA ligase [Actinomycetospora corticicola]NYD36434.1 prolyl-tRNA synthetase [Actinomycetospora corticicola]
MARGVTRMSELFLRTLREDPADAEVTSHKLLVRAGYVRRVAPGIYSWLPLGVRVLRNVERIVREEMDAIGAQEVHFPALLPREPYEATGRWTEYGDTLFRLKDRKQADYLLGPTHEELFTLMVKGETSSYRDFPVTLYQIQTKYRDEERPRAGILRGREFTMKDSYSFDLTDEGLADSYAAHRLAYQRLFDRLGLEIQIVSAMSGAMGGSASEEFLAPCDAGEDTYVRCLESGYAANVEAVTTTPPPEQSTDDKPEATVHDTPDTPTIDSLVAVARSLFPDRDYTAADTLKNVMVKTRLPGADEWQLLGVGVPGDREVDMKRLEAAVSPAEVALLEDADFARNRFLTKGYIGPVGLQKNGVRFLVDPRIVTGTAWITGADEPGRHVFDLVCGRDFTPDGTIEAAEVRAGDPSPDGAGTLVAARGIEMGHIFQLGRKYAQALGLEALGADGKRTTVTMGSYGVGVSRAVAAITEQHADAKGLVWPREVAPFDVHLVIAGKDETQRAAAETIAAGLAETGLEVLLDDRKASPGVKFADAELLGMPTSITVGRGLVNGVVEVTERRSGERREVPVDEVVSALTGA